MEAFTPLGFLLRFLAAIVLVLCTFNPSGYSYFHWVATVFPHLTPMQAIVGIRCCWSGGSFISPRRCDPSASSALAIALAFFAAVIWLIASWGWLDPHNATAMTWVVLVVCCGDSRRSGCRGLTSASDSRARADVDEVEQK